MRVTIVTGGWPATDEVIPAGSESGYRSPWPQIPFSGAVGKERFIAAAWAILFTALLALLIILGPRTLQNFDAALVGYTFAVLFSTFAIVYRYSKWLQRPPFWTIAPAFVAAWGSKHAICDG